MIELMGLTKRYGSVTALDQVSMSVSAGSVTALLGPNGAGKSTLMRIVMGLTLPTSGEALLFGKRYEALTDPGSRVGCLLDAGGLHPGRTGREELVLTRIALGLAKSRVDEVLDMVQLTRSESRRRVGTYSLGMKQRLALGNALMSDPEVVILDEPSNGLDPDGIVWMRACLRGLADRGCAVLVSSHLLHEVAQVADYIAVMSRGQLKVWGTLSSVAPHVGDIEEAYRSITRAAQGGELR